MAIPVSVITGFLGSGKTTLLSRLLRRPELADTAVIVNEFGEIGLDHLLVEASEDNIVELGTGCLCCTIREDLSLTLGDLLVRRDRGEIPAFRRVLIETSGLADPAPILHVLIADPALAERLALDTVVTTVDAVNGPETLDQHVESVKQAAVADALLVTKTDLPQADSATIEARLRALNPTAAIHRVAHGEIEPERLFGGGFYDLAGRSEDVRGWLAEEAVRASPHHHDHGHDLNRHDDRIRAYCIDRNEPVSAVAFSLLLETLAENCGPDLLRVKGLVDIAESPGRPAVIHGVQHVFHPPAWLEAWPGDDRKTRLVFITRDIPREWIDVLLEMLDDEAKETQARLSRPGMSSGDHRRGNNRSNRSGEMFDLIIRSDRVVTPQGVGEYDVAVKGEKIAAIGAPGSLGDASRIIDAKGKIVMPGGIDPHVHCSWPLPRPEGGHFLSDPPEKVSRAALYGGTTTIIDFANWDRATTMRQTIAQRDEDWAGKCHCDYSYHLMLQGELPPELVSEVGELIDEGYPTVKIFTTDITPSRRGRMVDFGDLWEVLKVVAAKGGLGVIHSEDNDIVMHMYDKLIAEGRVGFENMAEVHNTLSEDLSFRRVIRLAENIEGCALYMMHVSAATGVSAITESRARGFPIYGETLHQYMLFTSEDYKRPNGQIYHTYPSLKSRADQAALWKGTLNGSINAVATDEICCTLAVKVQGNQIDDTTGGNSAVEPRLGVMYAEMVDKRGYSLERYVDLVSTNAAKIMGLYPRKGALAPGSDADITILAPGEKRRVKLEDLHETDYSPWEGHEVSAWPTVTVLRGKIVVEDGEFRGQPADGTYLKRRIPKEILSGPAL